MSTQSVVRESSAGIVVGPKTPQLWEKTLSFFIDEQANRFQDCDAVVVPWQAARVSYRELAYRSMLVAKCLLALGLQHGDAVGIMGGNRMEYVEVFLGAGRIGCAAVVLNNTFSPNEVSMAVKRANCKVLFLAEQIGSRSLYDHLASMVELSKQKESTLQRVFSFKGNKTIDTTANIDGLGAYASFLETAAKSGIDDLSVRRRASKVVSSDILNLQFTSGTTGMPKAACLSHSNILNDARFVGEAMRLTQADVVCCPPPLFHCFGLVMGLLACLCYGSPIVFPSDNFNAELTIQAVIKEKATALLGVPTMFIAEMEVMRVKGYKLTNVRTGLAAGAMVSPTLMKSIEEEMHIPGMLIAYGMTETSPVTFITSLDDTQQRRYETIGRVLPHTSAKTVDSQGRTLPFGQRGEICTAGFALQRGYWQDEERTRQVMRQDENGVIWMHTGDEGYVDADGYGHVTGRIKDLIIRGGENISPAEIEDRLLAHHAISESCVVGLEDHQYGEVVACFLKASGGATERPSHESVRKWVSQELGRVKEPKYIFWVGDDGVGDDIPKTGSGKHQKHIARRIGNQLVKASKRVGLSKL